MCKQYFFLILLLITGQARAQVSEGLTAEERAYLFHIVKKSPILDNNLGRYFDYKGPMILLPNKEMNYDSVELIIMNQPEMLIIRHEEIGKSTKGIIAEAANKMALWELNKVLLAKRTSEKELEPYSLKYARFEAFLMEKLPEGALKEKDGEIKPTSKINNLLNPGLSFDDKVDFVQTLRFKDANEEKQTIDAISYAVNKYTEARTKEIYFALGGEADTFVNILVAAGDGSSTSGLLDEREKDEKGRWNRGLPKAVGLFPYQTKLVVAEKKKDPQVESMTYAEIDMQTVGNARHTNLHFDVWGYNSVKQTTVVLEKKGLSYPLFGSGETRFLSPDSSFSNGTTFMAIIQDLEKDKIANLNEMIYGKKGFDYWIEYNKKKKDETELKIEKKEYGFSELTTSTINTESKAPKSVKKAQKRARKSGGGPIDYQPKTNSRKKEKYKSSENIVDLYNQFNAYKKKIAELEQQREDAIDLMAIYQQRLDTYKRIIGQKWASYTEQDGLYTFEDSSTFDLMTQEFRFPASSVNEDFEVRLIAIPESSLSNQADEVMLHIHMCDAIPNYDARFQLDLLDVFTSDSWKLEKPLLSVSDSVALLQFFEGLLDKKVPFSITARGQGIGKWDGSRTVKDRNPVELSSYPGTSQEEKQRSRMEISFVRLRSSEVFIHLNRGIRMEVNSYTDPVASSIKITESDLLSLMQRYKLSKNDVLSAYRTAAILNQLKQELNVLAGTYLNREKASIVIDRFNKELAKTRVTMGATSVKISDLNR